MLQHASHESCVLVLRACKMILNLCVRALALFVEGQPKQGVVRWAQDAV